MTVVERNYNQVLPEDIQVLRIYRFELLILRTQGKLEQKKDVGFAKLILVLLWDIIPINTFNR